VQEGLVDLKLRLRRGDAFLAAAKETGGGWGRENEVTVT